MHKLLPVIVRAPVSMTTRTHGLTGLGDHLPDGRGRGCGIIGDWGGGEEDVNTMHKTTVA